MSLVYGERKVAVKKIKDPLTNFQVKRDFLTLESGKAKYFKRIPSTSYSNSQTNWSQINPPSAQTIMSRLVFMKVQMRVQATGTNTTPGANLLQTNTISLRSHPLANSMNSLNYTINGYQITRNLSKYIQTLLRLNNNTNDRELFESTTAAMFDNCQDYSQTYLTNQNPLAGYNDSTILTSGRGSINYDSFVTTPTTGDFTFTIYEPLHISPLLDKSYDEYAGLYNVSDSELLIVWETDLVSRMLSVNPSGGSTFSNLQIDFTSPPELLFRYMTPNLLETIPRNLVYPYCDHRLWQQTVGTIAAGAPFTVNSQNIQFSTIPDQLIIFLNQTDQTKNAYQPDFYAAIESISVDWNTQSGLLSSCDVSELYRLSVEAGLRMNYQDWSGKPRYLSVGSNVSQLNGIGSVLVLNPDILGFLYEGEACGELKNIMFNVTINCVNRNPNPVTYQLNILAAFQGILSIEESKKTYSNLGIVTPLDVLDAPDSGVDYNAAKHMAEMTGGSFWQTFKDVMSGVIKYLPVVGDVAKVLGNVGSGLSGGRLATRGALSQHLSRYRM